MRRLNDLLIALDQLLFCLASFGHGAPDETLSAAALGMDDAALDALFVAAGEVRL